jgi:deoxyribodipyrimidine photolyase-related protein
MKNIVIIFPHQLFKIDTNPVFACDFDEIHIVEDSIFFGDTHIKIPFHKSKLVFHRASMQAYFNDLKKHFPEKTIVYHEINQVSEINKNEKKDTINDAIQNVLEKIGINNNFYIIDPTDYLLEKRIRRVLPEIDFLESPMFLNSRENNNDFCSGKKNFLMHHFYTFQRRRLGILMDGDGTPTGGQWSFDHENRKKIPKKNLDEIPELPQNNENKYIADAKKYVQKNFTNNPGGTDFFWYPVTHKEALVWFEKFLDERFKLFGDYEDALVSGQNILYHSVLSPLLNVGLLDVKYVISRSLEFASENDTPINSLEGFIRQIIGWREYVRMQYEKNGTSMRNSNYWNHTQKLPKSLWDGTTGIPVVDEVINKINATGYLHHIERLMIIGNIMFLLEIEPDEVYLWFMSLSIDSYDWVMVPNIYGMSQHAAGNLITTKPYMSGSNYIKKMSNYGAGEWCETWDALYWNFLIKHKDKLSKNHRMQMITKRIESFSEEKKKDYKTKVDDFTDLL